MVRIHETINDVCHIFVISWSEETIPTFTKEVYKLVVKAVGLRAKEATWMRR